VDAFTAWAAEVTAGHARCELGAPGFTETPLP
jgi:hypothetical protein